RRLRERVELGHRLLERAGDVAVGGLVEPDVTVADLGEEDALPLIGRERLEPVNGKGGRDAAGESPDGGGTCPGHAAQEAATIESVVAVVASDEVGHAGVDSARPGVIPLGINPRVGES